MFRNYLATALRNLVRNRLYAAINLIGLTIGLTAALLMFLFVRDEFSYDRWVPGHERIYRISASATLSTRTYTFQIAPILAAPALKNEYPEVEAFTKIGQDSSPRSVGRGEREYIESVFWGDPNMFDLLQLPFIAGDPKTALADPQGVVLTRGMARKYFGRDDPLGETLEFSRTFEMKVTGVVEDFPSNTHFKSYAGNGQDGLAIILSGLSSRAPEHLRNLALPTASAWIYLRLAPGASPERLRADLPAFNARHPEFRQPAYPWTLDQLVAIADIHLLPAMMYAAPVKTIAAKTIAYSALAIALLIVAIASINFVNLATARALRRAVEVGVRKTSGAERRHLIIQFVSESTIYAVLGMAAATAIAAILLPPFNAFLQRTITLDVVRDPVLLGQLFVAVLVVGVGAGLYPAVTLSRFVPASVLKGRVGNESAIGWGRQVLVGVQFAVLIVLALVVTVVYRQSHYALNGALKFDTDQILLVTNSPCDTAFVSEVRALPGVRAAGCARGSPLEPGFPVELFSASGNKLSPGEFPLDFGYFEMYGIQPSAGRLFSRDFGADAVPQGSTAVPSVVMINESLSRALGFASPAEALGHTVRWTPRAINFISNFTEGTSEIVGVVPDNSSVREAPQPQIYWIAPIKQGYLNIKLNGQQVPGTLAAIDALWKKSGPPRPIDRTFLDRAVQEMYLDVTRLNQVLGSFAVVAVFISCLGLIGLAAATAAARTKEIGVRKALGAGKIDILRLMLWEFSRPVLWSSLAAWPVAYLIMRRWLEDFADRVDIGWWTFPLATALALAIAALTVLGQVLLVARAQPVTALRYE